jgi:uncharacterized protein (DUF1501 family)
MRQDETPSVLVCIFQRGGMDGLMAVAPFSDAKLAELRPRTKLPAPKSGAKDALLELDGVFGLHPAFEPIWPLYRDGKLAIIHGVGSPHKTRSHFDQQEYMETGLPGDKNARSGWLNRALCQMPSHDKSPFRAVSITSALPLALYGDESALAIPELESFGLRVADDKDGLITECRNDLKALYHSAANPILAAAGSDGFAALDQLERSADVTAPVGGAMYPEGCPLGKSLRQITTLIKSNLGLKIAWAEYPSADWDTHTNHAAMFAWQAGRMAKSIAAFYAELGELSKGVVVMTCTEFGRTVAENGSAGTDHGRATCFFLMGSDVAGGKVYGSVPLLTAQNLEDERDLPVTTDFRSVFAEIAAHQLGATDTAKLFPGWNGERLQLFRN